MYIIRLGIILMILAAIAAGGLALLNNQTAPIIEEYRLQQQAEARAEVTRSIGATDFEEVTTEDGFTYYRALDADSNLVGYVTTAYGKGYSSTIQTVAGYTTDFHVAGLKVIFQQETPGLGTKIEEVGRGEKEPWFLRQFKEKDALDLAVVQDRGDIDSITGATISSRAVANSVREAAERIRAEEGEGAGSDEEASDVADAGTTDATDADGEVQP